MASACMVIKRGISTTCICHGKRNFRKFLVLNKRGSRAFKQKQHISPDPDVPIDKRGVRDTGYKLESRWINVPEMIPELIVPSLEGFTLKPYVSYRTQEVIQSEFTAQDLFDAVYSKKIVEDFKSGQLGADGEPLNPSEHEKLTAEEAKNLAGKTGSDIFAADSKS